MTRQGIIDKTKAIMNEIGAEESLSLLSEDTVRLPEYIGSVIPDALNLIANNENTPYMLLNTATVSGASGTLDTEDMCTTVILPKDFMRFISLRLSGWKREVHVLHPLGSEEYKIQHNPITRSGVNKPSCVMAHKDKGDCIECFPQGTLRYFNYVKSANPNNVDAELGGYDDRLMLPVCYACAYLVYNIFEMPNVADKMMEIALRLIARI